MIGFKLNSHGDIEVVGGEIPLLSTIQEAVIQRLNIKLKTFQGEWFLDTTYGIPYRQSILGKGLSIKERDSIYIKTINDDPDVNRIVYFNSTFNPTTRHYSVEFEVNVDDELLRTETANLLPAEEIEYPIPDGSALSPSCDGGNIADLYCQLHTIVHCDLPACGEDTWIFDEEAMYVELGYADEGYIHFKAECDGECIKYVERDYVDFDYVGFSCSDLI